MEAHFQRTVKKELPFVALRSSSESPSRSDAVLYEDKVQFAQEIKRFGLEKRLSENQLGEIVRIVKEECPEAFNEISKTQCQILVESIGKDVFEKLFELDFN